MRKTLIYLDQSYLSTMAKEEMGETRQSHVALALAMSRLLERLRALVNADKVLCPHSHIHDQETSFDSKIEDGANRILRELSDDVRFHFHSEIILGQSLRAMKRDLKLETEPDDGRWQHALDSNPHNPVKRPRIYVHIPWPDVFIKDDRKRKTLMQDFRERSATVTTGPYTFSEYRRQEMAGVVNLVYVEPYKQYLGKMITGLQGTNPFPTMTESSTDNDFVDYLNAIAIPPAISLFDAYCSLTGLAVRLPDKAPRFWEFFASPDFDAIPYYDIFCSLAAGFRFHKRDRRPRPSDPYDFAALSTVLPYVDIVTTDSSMKDMVIQLGLDKKYGVEVYSSRQSDVEALENRLSQIG